MISSSDLSWTLFRSGSFISLFQLDRDIPTENGPKALVMHHLVDYISSGGDCGLVGYSEDREAHLGENLKHLRHLRLILSGDVGELFVKGDELSKLEAFDQDDAEQEGNHVLHATAERVHGGTDGHALAHEEAVRVASCRLFLLNVKTEIVGAEDALQTVRH